MRISLNQYNIELIRLGGPIYIAQLEQEQAQVARKLEVVRAILKRLAGRPGAGPQDENPLPVAQIKARFRKQEDKRKRRDPLSRKGRARQIAGVKRYHAKKRRAKKQKSKA